MARVKRGVTSHARHKKVLKLAKGSRGASSRLIKTAKQRVDKAHKSRLSCVLFLFCLNSGGKKKLMQKPCLFVFGLLL